MSARRGCLHLDSESVLRRIPVNRGAVKIPSLGDSLRRGMVGFTLLSVAGFAPWAFAGRWFYRHTGEVGLYLLCAIVFIVLSGPLLHRLIIGPGSLVRFYQLFALTFTLYAVLWIAGWISLRGNTGSMVGLLAGTAVMGGILAYTFDAKKTAWKVILALFVLNAAGYFLGGVLHEAVMKWKNPALFGSVLSKPGQSLLAKLLWGVSYGIGFGAGLGLAFHWCQERIRASLRQMHKGETTAEIRS